MTTERFTLFVAGRAAPSTAALYAVRDLLERHFPGRHELRVVDVLEDPASAETARVLATPTLERTTGRPPSRVVGDLSDQNRVLMALGFWPQPPKSDPEPHEEPA